MFTSSTRDGSYLAHLNGAQSVIAHRNGSTLQDGNNHLALLCTHMVGHFYISSRPISVANLRTDSMVFDRSQISTVAPSQLGTTDPFRLGPQKAADMPNFHYCGYLCQAQGALRHRRKFRTPVKFRPPRGPGYRLRASEMDLRLANRVEVRWKEPHDPHKASRLGQKTTYDAWLPRSYAGFL